MTSDGQTDRRDRPASGPEIGGIDDLQAMTAGSLLDRARELAVKAREDGRGSSNARELGRVLVALRTRYLDKQGRQDMRGSSWDYRTAVSGLWERAGANTADSKWLQTSSRRHAQDYMRENMSAEDCQAYGLTVIGPTERNNRARSNMSVLANAVSQGVLGSGAEPVAPLRMSNMVLELLRRAADERLIAAMAQKETQALADVLSDVADLADRMRLFALKEEPSIERESV